MFVSLKDWRSLRTGGGCIMAQQIQKLQLQ
jgi:hypothetical protein